MTELEIMKRAKMYMDQLSQGIDPVSGARLAGDSALNQQRLSKCFSYVSGVLQQVIDNGGVIGAVEKEPFFMTAEQIARIRPADRALRITEFADYLLQNSPDPSRKRPNITLISKWLVDKGYLCQQMGADGKNHRVPTETGQRAGMFLETVPSQYGEYSAVYYSSQAQQVLLNALPEILNLK